MSPRSATAWIALFAVVAAAGLHLMDGGEAAQRKTTTRGSLGEQPERILTARTLRVVDGDTINVQSNGRRDTVRYIGVDTPESVKPDTPVECFAKAASHFNEQLVEGRDVQLTLDREPRDKYGRLLAYVAVSGRSVNAELLRRGYARTIEIPPNTSRAATFRRLEDSAQAAGRGLWGACR